VKNLLTINYFNFYHGRNGIDKITTERDNDIWPRNPGLTPFYNRLYNAVYISPEVLQPPQYSLDADPAIKYAVLGHMVGHEIGHGLDRVNIYYSSDGRQRELLKSDYDFFRLNYNELTHAFIQYETANKSSVNLTAAEQEIVADAYGLEAAYDAYRTAEPTSFSTSDSTGFFGDQRFFIAFAQGMQTDPRDEQNYLPNPTLEYPIHPCRVNGSVSSMGHEMDSAFYRENRSSHTDGISSLPIVDFSGNQQPIWFLS
jgi:predicted metalloendopeptidase